MVERTVARPVLVTGATGYVGGRLAPLLLARGHQVRAAGRSADKVLARPWAHLPGCEAVALNVFDPDSLVAAMRGCQAAYYLVHSMGGGHSKDFAAKDRLAANNFAQAAAQAGVERIIYLGGLGDEADPHLSVHLHSRIETGKALQAGPVPLTWLRAAVILGSGSASFEIIRYLVDRLPLMITPRWVDTKSQPIAIANVLGYLTGCLETPETSGQVFDIGGPDIVAYRKLFHLYAQAAGLRKRLIIPVPLLTPRLSALWVNLVTPVSMSLIRPLIEGLRNEAVCADNRIRDLVPQKLLTCQEAMERALSNSGAGSSEGGPTTCCYDAGDACLPEWAACGDAPYAGGSVLGGRYEAVLDGGPDQVWPLVARLGGDTGWYFGDWLWRMRGFLDKLVGGPGLRRGRRHPEEIRLGDALDFWRVVEVRENERLLLKAEMKVPGEALLEFNIEPREKGTALAMRSMFKPKGIAGLLYWWSTWPFHELIFRNMHRRMAKAAGLALLSPAKKVST